MFQHVTIVTVLFLSFTTTTASSVTTTCFVGSQWHCSPHSSNLISKHSRTRERHDSRVTSKLNEGGVTPIASSSINEQVVTTTTSQEQGQTLSKSLSLTTTTVKKTSSRREALFQIIGTTATAATLLSSQPALAGLPEIDTKSGELFSPKQEMLGGGGSTAARGIRLQELQRQDQVKKKMFDTSAPIQNVYETRFIAYLSRFLLNFDPAASAWWKEGLKKIKDTGAVKTATQLNKNSAVKLQFAEFAESVEVGLANYFVGPYGSYASVQAAKAGINAVSPATSSFSGGKNKDRGGGFGTNNDAGNTLRLSDVFGKWGEEPLFGNRTKISSSNAGTSKRKNGSKQGDMKLEKQGILNLYALLKARYTSREAKKQLALLFSMISSPMLQPKAEIEGLLGELDNATLTQIDLVQPAALPSFLEDSGTKKVKFRSSSRRGGGYSILTPPPKVFIEPPKPLGDDYKPAKGVAIMKPTTRILRINVTDGGEGYTSAPSVTVFQNSGGILKRQCDACAIIDREGRVESIIVLDPGLGYGGNNKKGEVLVPTVMISKPKQSNRKEDKKGGGKLAAAKIRQAKAVAELEYEVVGVDITSGGSGYVLTQPPDVYLTPSDNDPDWFVPKVNMNIKRGPFNQGVEGGSGSKGGEYLKAQVTTMQGGYDKILTDTSAISSTTMMVASVTNTALNSISDEILQRVIDDPIGLLPSNIRPDFRRGEEESYYRISCLPPLQTNVPLPSPRYRAIDPLFGGIGKAPVTKGAMSLSVSEYSRLALSGAVCTVIVRTLLNPLELIKTKIQLGNDKELTEFTLQKALPSSKQPVSQKTPKKDTEVSKKSVDNSLSASTIQVQKRTTETEDAIGTLAMIKSLIELRGPLSLFQSADITFLASLVFGSFGFGATELFRRFFTSSFFDDTSGGNSNFGSELILLAAAALATVITSAAATPFETIRVRSMGIIESKGWKTVLGEFLAEKRMSRGAKTDNSDELNEFLSSKESFRLRDIKRDDLGPLLAGFSPIVSRELPFAITKFLVFDLVATAVIALINSQQDVIEPVQVGVGAAGLAVSAGSGALAGIAGALVSHPADLILTLTSVSKGQETSQNGNKKSGGTIRDETKSEVIDSTSPDWRQVLKEILQKEGGALNLFAGFPARATFFFLVIGLQFFLYDYVKSLFRVGSEDLQLVLDVFYAIRQGLV